MCEYCENEKELAISKYKHCWMFIRRDWRDGGYNLIANEDEYNDAAMARINNCPMCGRDLKGGA